jgi:hypothetical protein
MKIVITEQQLRKVILSEQPESRFLPSGMTYKDHLDAVNTTNRSKLSNHLDADDYADVVSGLIDVIPGIGNLISGGIDITHGITYIVRYFYAKTIEDKAEMAVMGLLTLGMAFIPVGGNVANIVAKGEIKSLLKQTPHEVLVTAKNMGLIKNAGFKLSKETWKYSILIALAKVFRGSLDNVIGEVTRKLTYIANNSKELNPPLQDYIATINELKGYKSL